LGLEELQVNPGDRALVIGSGPIDVMAAVLAQVGGAEGERLAAARRMGVARVVDLGPGDVETAVRSAEADAVSVAVFDAMGKPETWAAATRLVRPGGRMTGRNLLLTRAPVKRVCSRVEVPPVELDGSRPNHCTRDEAARLNPKRVRMELSGRNEGEPHGMSLEKHNTG